MASSVLLYVVPFLCGNWNGKVWLKLFGFKSIQAPFRSSIPKMSMPRGVHPRVSQCLWVAEWVSHRNMVPVFKLSTSAAFPSVTQVCCPFMRNSPPEDTWRVSFQQLWHRNALFWTCVGFDSLFSSSLYSSVHTQRTVHLQHWGVALSVLQLVL